VLRVTRIIKLAKKNKDLQALMQTITLSVGPLSNVFLLLMLVLFIFSILAVFFFSTITEGNIISDMRNFKDFGNSFLTLFVISTGENWNMLMYDCIDTPPNCIQGQTCGTSLAPVFFIIFVLFVQNVMLNLFILVIISQFETYYMGDDNPIIKYQVNMEVFMKTWIEFTVQKYRCIKLREKQLNSFFKALPPPFGLPAETTDDQMKKVMLKMGIRCDDGYVYFNELLYRCMRR
jgi:voltage-dependent calcium channel R type alpha-1E